MELVLDLVGHHQEELVHVKVVLPLVEQDQVQEVVPKSEVMPMVLMPLWSSWSEPDRIGSQRCGCVAFRSCCRACTSRMTSGCCRSR